MVPDDDLPDSAIFGRGVYYTGTHIKEANVRKGLPHECSQKAQPGAKTAKMLSDLA